MPRSSSGQRRGRSEGGRAQRSSASGKRSRSAGEAVDCLQLLEQQHRAVEAMFAQIGRGGGDQRMKILELADALTMHAAIEERHFYPVLHSGATSELVEHAMEEHDEAKRLLLQILESEPGDEQVMERIDELRMAVMEHVEEEEGEIFAQARQRLSPDLLEGLAQEMTATMVELQEEGEPHEQLYGELGPNAEPR